MLRAALFSAVLMFPAAAFADDPAEGLAVRSDDGAEMGRVVAVERDADGRIVAVAFEGLEAPADAPQGMAEAEPEFRIPETRRPLVASNERSLAQGAAASGGSRRAR